MQCYELDLKKPIRGMLAGELARTLLIQVGWAGLGWLGWAERWMFRCIGRQLEASLWLVSTSPSLVDKRPETPSSPHPYTAQQQHPPAHTHPPLCTWPHRFSASR